MPPLASRLVPLPLLPLILGTAAVACAPLSLEEGSELRVSETGAADPHVDALGEDPYPSAEQCRTCHPDHYREWSVSPHAYTQVSPVFNAMQGTIQKQTNGTLGDFCIRCHTPVGMALGEPIFTDNASRAPVSREGVTCVACHRVDQAFGKTSARYALVDGGIFAPVSGPRDGSEQARVLADPERYGSFLTEPADGTGRRIHSDVRYFEPLTTASSCATCHEILLTGFREDESVSEYKRSPAARRGETCQDCHMGRTAGRAEGYHQGPAAIVGDEPTAPAKRTDHMFVGPDHSVVHPAIFPHNPDAAALATIEEWLQFDYEAGWGTDAFEDEVDLDAPFPERWAWPDDRYDAREILDDQLELLAESKARTLELLRNGFAMSEIRTTRADEHGLGFELDISNIAEGHNAPTGFIGERVVFVQVRVTDAEDRVVFESGDTDPNGAVRDRFSLYVRNGELPFDDQLFTLTSNFVTSNVHGAQRPQLLSVNFSLDPLPFVRPDTRSTVLTGRKATVRIQKRTIEPGGKRTASYSVPGSALTGNGPYTATARLVVAMVSTSLLHEIQGVGFDYGLSARRIGDAITAGRHVVHERSATLVGS